MHTFGKKCHILIAYVILGMSANEREWVIYITRETNPSHSEQKHIWTKRLQRLHLIYIPWSSVWGSQVFQLAESLATMNERPEELLGEEWKKLVSSYKRPPYTSRVHKFIFAAPTLNVNYYSPFLVLKISLKLWSHHSMPVPSAVTQPTSFWNFHAIRWEPQLKKLIGFC